MERKIFENTTTGYLGAIKITRSGERRSVAVEPGARVELSREEQEATAESHRSERGNPFIDQPYEIRDRKTGDVIESGKRPPLQLVTDRRPIGEEVGAATPPAADAPEGEYTQGEEVGTPLKTAADIRVGAESG